MDVRRNDLARVELDSREVRGIVEDVHEPVEGHVRAVVRDFDTDEEVDIAANRVEVVR